MTSPTPPIRDALPEDAQEIADIYGPIVESTAISFETHRPTVAEMARRIRQADRRWPWLVMEGEGHLRGFARASEFRQREAYRYTAQTSVYVHPADQGMGVGTALMQALLARLHDAGHHIAVAGITLPNPESVALHERLGFSPVGVFREVGRKFFTWYDVGYWMIDLDAAY